MNVARRMFDGYSQCRHFNAQVPNEGIAVPSTVRKWGNSLGIRLPKPVAEQANLTDGTDIEFAVDDGVAQDSPRPPGAQADAGGVARPSEGAQPAPWLRRRPAGRAGVAVSYRAYTPNRGDLIHVNFSPSAGHEMADRHYPRWSSAR